MKKREEQFHEFQIIFIQVYGPFTLLDRLLQPILGAGSGNTG